MYQIVWNYKGMDYHVDAFTDEDRDALVMALVAAGYSGKVYHKAEPKEGYVIRVKYVNAYGKADGRCYSYKTEKAIEVGTMKYVPVFDAQRMEYIKKPAVVYECVKQSNYNGDFPLSKMSAA